MEVANLADTFSDSMATPHIVVTTNSQGDWGRWNNPDGPNEVTAFDDVLFGPISVPADTPLTEARQMREDLEWPVRNRGVDRRGADVLSGFSGQPMGADPDSEFFRQYIDARSGTAEGERYSGPLREEGTFDDEVELTGGVTIVGTNDPPGVTNLRTVDHIYMHELGHVLGAVHPNNQDSPSSSEEFGIEPRTGGVMCKDSCIDPLNDGFGVDDLVDPPEASILTGEFYAEPNKNRILNLDYDYKDRGDERGGENIARSLSTVAKASDPPE